MKQGIITAWAKAGKEKQEKPQSGEDLSNTLTRNIGLMKETGSFANSESQAIDETQATEIVSSSDVLPPHILSSAGRFCTPPPALAPEYNCLKGYLEVWARKIPLRSSNAHWGKNTFPQGSQSFW